MNDIEFKDRVININVECYPDLVNILKPCFHIRPEAKKSTKQIYLLIKLVTQNWFSLFNKYNHIATQTDTSSTCKLAVCLS